MQILAARPWRCCHASSCGTCASAPHPPQWCARTPSPSPSPCRSRAQRLDRTTHPALATPSVRIPNRCRLEGPTCLGTDPRPDSNNSTLPRTPRVLFAGFSSQGPSASPGDRPILTPTTRRADGAVPEPRDRRGAASQPDGEGRSRGQRRTRPLLRREYGARLRRLLERSRR